MVLLVLYAWFGFGMSLCCCLGAGLSGIVITWGELAAVGFYTLGNK